MAWLIVALLLLGSLLCTMPLASLQHFILHLWNGQQQRRDEQRNRGGNEEVPEMQDEVLQRGERHGAEQ